MHRDIEYIFTSLNYYINAVSDYIYTNLKVEKRWDAQRFYDYVFTYRTYVGRFLQLRL